MTFLHDLERSGKWILGVLVAFFVLHNGGIVEGMIAPVVTIAKITISENSTHDGWAEVSGEFDKIRDCRFESLEWYWKGEKSDSRIAMTFSKTQTRGAGHQVFDKWRLQMPADQVKGNSYVLVYHSCHPIWKTVTRFYP